MLLVVLETVVGLAHQDEACKPCCQASGDSDVHTVGFKVIIGSTSLSVVFTIQIAAFVSSSLSNSRPVPLL